MGVPAREPERPTWQEKVVSSFGQTLQSLISSTPAWAWTTGGTVLVLLIVALFSQGFGLWAEPGPTMTPSETLPAASTATATVEPTLTSTSSTPRPAVTSTPTWLPDVPPPNASLGDTWTRPTDEAVMVYVPAGEFEMGSTEGDSDEQPVHDVTLDGFWIDKHEVTNAQFAAFLNEKGNQEEGGTTWLELDSDDCLIEKSGEEFRPKSGYADHPVVEVSWYGAKAYAKWVGGQLPSEAEWEYAARGPMFIPGATNLMGQG
jgi:formylglycine-generating enzyme required for sulfatase activity